MRILIISDIHGNSVALDAVLAHAGRYDAVWCLGDLIGYGPNPNESVARVRELPNLICLVGNHDKAVLGEIDLNAFNYDAQAALSWTQRTITPETRAYIESLQASTQQGDFTLVHASPRQPIWEYILDPETAGENFAYFKSPYCLVGHTHVPVIYHEPPPGRACREEAPDYGRAYLLNSHRLIINPGSVGQPRDSNPDAAYAVLNTQPLSWEYRRVPYDVALTQERMRAADLPDRLIARIAYGW